MNRYSIILSALFEARPVRSLLPALGLLCLFMFSGFEGSAQHLINDESTYTQNFNSFTGLNLTGLNNWSWLNTNYGGIYNRSGVYNDVNSTYALKDSSISQNDVAFGGKFGMGEEILTFRARNNTNTDILGFSVTWNVEQYSQCSGTTMIEFSYSIGGSTNFTTAGTPTSTITTSGTCDNLPGIDNVAKTVIVTPPVPVASMQIIEFRFRFISTGGNNAHVGIDNFTMTPVLKPTIKHVGTSPETDLTIAIGANKILYRVAVTVQHEETTLMELNVATAGTWGSQDVENFKLYYDTDANFSGSTLIGTAATLSGAGQSVKFSDLFRTIPAGTSYLFIVAEISSSCDAVGNTIIAGPTMIANFVYNQQNLFNILASTFAPATQYTIIAAPGIRLETSDGETKACGSSLNFGTLPLGYDTSITLKIYNTGCSELNLNEITVSSGSNYFVPDFSPLTIAPGGFYEIAIFFSPQSSGMIPLGTLTISGSGGVPNCTLNLNGSGRPSADPVFPDLVTPNDDGHNDFFDIIFPSGTSGEAPFVLEVFNRAGGMLKSMEGFAQTGRQQIWSPAGFPDGVYYYRLTFNEKVYRGAVTIMGRQQP